MEKIVLSDGREYETSFFGITSTGYMFINVAMGIGEAAGAFSIGTDRITHVSENDESTEIRGFTKIAYIVNEEGGSRVALVRPLDITYTGET